MIGIVSYGAWAPFLRLKVEDIADVWANTSISKITKERRLSERGVLQPNEDSNTMAAGAARRAVDMAGGCVERVDAAFLGTCTNSYDTRASVTVIQEALGLRRDIISADVQFGGKSGTAAMQLAYGLVKAGMARRALAIGSDTINRHTAPGTLHEYAASSGAAALIIGDERVIAEIKGTASYSSELSDFFRIEGDRYIQDSGFCGQPYPEFEIGMMAHIEGAANGLLSRLGMSPSDFDYAVFQQPYGSIPYILAERLGFTKEQTEAGVVADRLGDCGSASALLGLANVLDKARAGQRIFLCSYGCGAGADAFVLETTEEIEKVSPKKTVEQLIDYKRVVGYADAIRYEYKYMQEMHPFYQ